MKRIKIGVFGAWRGSNYVNIINGMEGYELTAVCDKRQDRLDALKPGCNGSVKYFNNFDDFIDSGMDAVLLCNYFNEHTPYAIKAMERGIHVVSECTSSSTLKECVELCRAVEKTDCKYMIGENYPFTCACLDMERMYREGTLGKVLYAEGEYNHGGSETDLRHLTPEVYHWRGWMPRTYYCTHSLGPLMYMTKAMPSSVNARAVHSDVLESYDDFRHNYDASAIMLCEMDDGSLFRFTGCAAFPSPSRFRLVGEFGSIQTGGGNNGINVSYYPWTLPEGETRTNYSYEPQWPEMGESANKAEHGGGDFWVLYNFYKYITEEKKPFFDVYRGAAMSAVGILGWRSCLNGGKEYKIPDFSDESSRKSVEYDNLTPFPDQDGKGVTLPCSTKDAKTKGFCV
ncbi:MAG: Gfo/Idh/MocA family protein [Eubacteriales bacterium]